MSLKSDSEISEVMSDTNSVENGGETRRRSRFADRRNWTGSLTRTKKNSRVATVRPVTKYLSSSEEDLSKPNSGQHTPRKPLGSTSPRVARLLNNDLTGMNKDTLISELERCLNELEKEQSASVQPLEDDFQRIEDERNELAEELEIAFEDLEEYIEQIRKVEGEKKAVEIERDELAKEVDYLKFALTNRQQIKECQAGTVAKQKQFEDKIKELTEENDNLRNEVADLYDERQSLIDSLLNLNSEPVNELVKSRSRSCSTISLDSSSSSHLRGEVTELRDRLIEAEEAEHKLDQELIECRNILETVQKEKVEMEDKFNNMSSEYQELLNENTKLQEDIDRLQDRIRKNDSDGSKRIEELRQVLFAF